MGSGMTHCKKCSSLSVCTECEDGYFVNGSNKCQACIANCKKCSNATTCEKCDNNYAVVNSKCWNYTCDDLTQICVMTKHDGSKLSMYKFPLGAESLSNLSAMGITECHVGEACNVSGIPACFVKQNFGFGTSAAGYTSNIQYCSRSEKSFLSGCDWPQCTSFAALKAQAYLGGAWRGMSSSDWESYIVPSIRPFYDIGVALPFCAAYAEQNIKLYPQCTMLCDKLIQGAGYDGHCLRSYNIKMFDDKGGVTMNTAYISVFGQIGTFMSGFYKADYPTTPMQIYMVKTP